MKAFVLPGVLGAAFIAAVSPLSAHHSFAAEYDAKQQITIKGTVNSVEASR